MCSIKTKGVPISEREMNIKLLKSKCENCRENLYMLGVDGGGTKTEFLLFCSDGTQIKRIVLGCSNPNVVGIEKCAQLLKSGIDEMLGVYPQIKAVYIGAAGFLLGNNAETIKKELESYYDGRFDMIIQCKTDVLNVIACADLQQTDCMAVICGTGFSVVIKEKNIIKTSAGWGFLVNKWGSGFDVGRDGLYYALMDTEGIGETTLITEIIKDNYGEDIYAVLRDVYSKGQSYVAGFAKIVFEAYLKGDVTAKKIIEDNAACVAKIINQVSKIHPNITQIVLSGGLFANSTIYADLVKKNIAGNLVATVIEFPQIYGACLESARMSGVNTKIIKENFVEEYRKWDK